MNKYKTREIKFNKIVDIDEWRVKLYTISKDEHSKSNVTYQNALNKLPEWLNKRNSFDASNDKIAFLIIHSGTEGVFSIINWWVGKNMLNTHIFISKHNEPDKFELISGDGLSPCIWELEVINHERNSWIKNVLKKSDFPDYEEYLKDNYNGTL